MQPFAKPDPGVLFDSLMARSGFEPHPNKISSMLFYLATIIIHDVFKTSHQDSGISLTSSYLDLAPLYGSNQEQQDAMRTFKDGMLKPDCFSEKRVLGFPPGVGVLLVMFNRFHNYIASQLAMINENDRFKKPKDGSPYYDAGMKKYDNDLFQTARLITCGLYVNLILKDYVRVILNLHRSSSTWDLDPRTKCGKAVFGNSAAEGCGNQVSAEFNLVYRWHATISERDAQWTEDMYSDLFPGKNPKDVSVEDLMHGLRAWESTMSADPQERCFQDMKRDANGKLEDQPLVDILQASVEDVAGSFGANRVPHVMRSIEILGICQARSWNLATLNDFRKYFNLAPHKTFEDINPDPYVAEQLKHLYGTPDLVELYPGLVVEEAKKRMDVGSGLCPSFTVSRAVLSDAVALVRGDRFYTIDYTPGNLTNWGFTESNYDNEIDQGHVFYKLILRAFPDHFKPNSVFAHFPMVIPSETELILKKLEKDDMYSFDPPQYIPKPRMINSYATGTKILGDKIHFGITWGPTVTYLMQNDGYAYGSDFMLSGDGPHCAASRQLMQGALYKHGWEHEVRKFYERITCQLLAEKSYRLAGDNEVDIVRDVGNYAQVHFSAEVFNLPLKTAKHPLAPYTEHELYLVMALVFICIFFDKDPAKSFPLHVAARKVTQDLGHLVEARLKPLGLVSSMEQIMDLFHQKDPLPAYGKHMIMKLLESGLGLKDIVWSQILGTAGGMVSIQGQLFAQVLDFYLREENAHHFKVIQSLAKMNTGDADDQILRYFMEGARIASSVALPRTVNQDIEIEENGEKIGLKKGDKVVVNLVRFAPLRDQSTFITLTDW
jgi:linoleate 8R-lipoxygenase/9,12-octadecadienoate 8-hydroperoxide 8R-isomerase